MADAEQLSAEMHAFYPRYIDSFNGDDAGAYVANFSFPSVLLGGKQAVIVVNDAGTWINMMTKTKEIMKSKGWARTAIDVSIVAGSVQLSRDGQVIRVHPIRHDRSRELGAFANPKGRPRRKNSAIGLVAQVPESICRPGTGT